jgi:hypothetical protein
VSADAVTILRAGNLNNAGKMGLRSEARSPAAQLLVQTLLEDIVVPAWPAGKQQRRSSLAASGGALAAILGDLLRLEVEDRAGSFGASPKDFTSLPFGRDVFVRVRDALVASRYLHVHLGRQQLTRFTNHSTGSPGPVMNGGGQVSRFRLTSAALEACASAGVALLDWQTHWGRAAPIAALKPSAAPLLVRRARGESVHGVKSTGKDMAVDATGRHVAELVADLEAHNAFVSACGVGGIAFAGLRRVFNDGDQPGFAWQWGGRFYSAPSGEAYEQLGSAERLASITLGGQPIGEIDIRASHLSFLYALAGAEFDPGAQDPYAIGGISRDIVKQWIAQALGRGDISATRWSPRSRDAYSKIAADRRLSKDYPFKGVGEAVLKRHPVLRSLGRPGVPSALDLQFHESEVLRGAMALLRARGIPSLPVHDSLLLPSGLLSVAEEAIGAAFRNYIEAIVGSRCTVVLAIRSK